MSYQAQGSLNQSLSTYPPTYHVMRDHVKALRKRFQSKTKAGLLVAASNCAKCGTTAEESGRKLELHHIVSLSSLEPDDQFDPNVQDNLTTLCHRCHQSFHKCFEDVYGDDIQKWIEEVDMDDVISKFKAYRAMVAEKNRFHRDKRLNK